MASSRAPSLHCLSQSFNGKGVFELRVTDRLAQPNCQLAIHVTLEQEARPEFTLMLNIIAHQGVSQC